MTDERDTLDEALDAFKATMKWSLGVTETEKALVLGNLNGFASHLRREGFFRLPPHPENCNRYCCD